MSQALNEKRWRWGRGIQVGLVALTALFLVLTAAFLVVESSWARPVEHTPEEAFREGTIGTEVVPLPVLQVLPDLFPEHFQPAGPAGGDWVEQFGFVRKKASDPLPVGFTVTHYRPKSGAPSPVPFVGFGCAMCHSAKIRRSDADDDGVVVYGAGNMSMDFIAWVNAFQAAVLDDRNLTPETIAEKYREKGLKPDLTVGDTLMIRLWLSNTRKLIQTAETKYDEPYRGPELRDSTRIPTGPSRTQPFRNLVRIVLDRPGETDRAYTKFPAVFHQGWRHWAQFDGAIHDYHARSALAALSAGATVDNLALPEICDNVKKSTDYTMDFGGPSFADVLGVKPDAERVKRGRDHYNHHCADCHGSPGGQTGTWTLGERQARRQAEQQARGPLLRQALIISADEVHTDPERIHYRYYGEIANPLFNLFPKGHPLHFQREDLCPGPAGTDRGYIASPIESAWLRAPYLHNGSVLTLAELINLKERRTPFYRGKNLYDPDWVGLAYSKEPDARRYFLFDATRPGNSNKGHDYPWPYHGPGWDEEALKDLLEYLKTL